MDLQLDWKFSNMPQLDIAASVTQEIGNVARKVFPDIADMFPMTSSPEMNYYFDNDWMIFTLVNRYAISAPPAVGLFSEDKIRYIKENLPQNKVLSSEELYSLFGDEWFSFDRFTYVGPFSPEAACWTDIFEHIKAWLISFVVPTVLERNNLRVLRAVPIPPQYNISEISSSLWILECEQTCKQGTGFELQGYGIVTCSHVLGTDTKAFKADNPNSKYKVHVIKNNPVIDLSILQIEGVDLKGLAIGSSDNLNLMDHVAISGFPNYRLGDTGVFIPGLVVGFRMVSSIRRILTNAPIIAGNSGGPVLDAQGEVIGVAVTGADKMEDAQQTENHAIIPIDALGLL